MTQNVGGIDRVLRIVAGVLLLAFAIFSHSSWSWVGFIGVVPLLTAAMGWCPAYTLVGLNTCPMKQ